MKKGRKRYWFLGVLAVLLAFWYWQSLPPHYAYEPHELPKDFDTFYQQQLQRSQELNARPGNEEKLIRFAPKTPLAFVYIHGFTASRAEGEYVMDSLAQLYQANTYYLRLPGHGTNKEDHAAATFADYLDAGMDALIMAQELGDTVIVFGTSMGGLVATYIAALRPDLVDALVLNSPFYDYAGMDGKLLKIPGMLRVIQWVDGPERPMNRSAEWRKRIKEGYDNYWYPEQLYQSLQSLEDLRNFAACNTNYGKVAAPVLLMYYYRDKDHQDGAASVHDMKHAYAEFASTQANDPRNKLVAIENGEHVMMSEYVVSDKDAVFKEVVGYVERLREGSR